MELVVGEDHGQVVRAVREEDGLVVHAEVTHCLFWNRNVGVFGVSAMLSFCLHSFFAVLLFSNLCHASSSSSLGSPT